MACPYTCTQVCSQCGGDCGGGCTDGCDGGSGKDPSGGGGCVSWGTGACGWWCATGCITCSQGCGSGCASSCEGCGASCGGCDNSCSGNCQGCSGCSGSCSGSCSGWCKGGCASKCTAGCGNVCNSSCSSVLAIEAYNHLKDIYNNNKLEWLEDVDIVRLLQLLQEEGRRRMTPAPYSYQLGYGNIPSSKQKEMDFRGAEDNFLVQEYPTLQNGEYNFALRGTFTDDELIKRIASLLANNAKKSTSKKASEGTFSKKDLGKEYIQKALQAGSEMVPVNTTSEEAR